MSLREDIRAAISNAYYENRGAGQTMETAADDAVEAVMRLLQPNAEGSEDQRPVSLGSLEYDLSQIPGKDANVWAQTPDGLYWAVLVANTGVAYGLRGDDPAVSGDVVLRLLPRTCQKPLGEEIWMTCELLAGHAGECDMPSL